MAFLYTAEKHKKLNRKLANFNEHIKANNNLRPERKRIGEAICNNFFQLFLCLINFKKQ